MGYLRKSMSERKNLRTNSARPICTALRMLDAIVHRLPNFATSTAVGIVEVSALVMDANQSSFHLPK